MPNLSKYSFLQVKSHLLLWMNSVFLCKSSQKKGSIFIHISWANLIKRLIWVTQVHWLVENYGWAAVNSDSGDETPSKNCSLNKEFYCVR